MTSGHNSSPSSVRGSSGSARLGDRKSTRLNSSHSQISYAVFCLKKKKLLPDLLPSSLSQTFISADRTPYVQAYEALIPGQPSPALLHRPPSRYRSRTTRTLGCTQ